MLGLVEQSSRGLGGGPGRHHQTCERCEFRELRDAVDALQDAFHAAGKFTPFEFGGAGDGAKTQHETIGKRRAQQRFRGPYTARTVELRGRGARDFG